LEEILNQSAPDPLFERLCDAAKHRGSRIKRLHDQDMSGVWVLACFVPYLGELFSLIVLGCLKGTGGSNDYGADPLEPPEKAET